MKFKLFLILSLLLVATLAAPLFAQKGTGKTAVSPDLDATITPYQGKQVFFLIKTSPVHVEKCTAFLVENFDGLRRREDGERLNEFEEALNVQVSRGQQVVKLFVIDHINESTYFVLAARGIDPGNYRIKSSEDLAF